MTALPTRGIALLIVACFLLGGLGFASLIAVRNYRSARWLIQPGARSPLLSNPGDTKLEGLQPVTFVSRGSHLVGWYVPSKNHAAVVVVHGAQSDRAAMLPEIRLLAAAGFGVLAFDWPGLGQSEGEIRWGAEARDALSAAVDWLAARPDVDPSRIGGLGFSIGGFVLTQVAAKDPRLRAVVIESAASDFDAYLDVHQGAWGLLSKWPAKWGLRNSGLFSADDSALGRIGEISPRPVFIIGQTGDLNVPEAMTRTLAEAARPPKQVWLIPGARHGAYEAAAGVEYPHRLQAFFENNLGQAVESSPQRSAQ